MTIILKYNNNKNKNHRSNNIEVTIIIKSKFGIVIYI